MTITKIEIANFRQFIRALFLLGLALTLGGCAARENLPLEQQPGFAETRSLSLPPLSSEDVRQGSDLYASNCARCHGADGSGKGPVAAEASTAVRDLRDARGYRFGSEERSIFRTVKYGVSGTVMLGFKSMLGDREIWQVTAYVRSLQQKGN